MNEKKLLGKARFLAVATLFSRILALVRDMAMAWLLGTGPVADCLVAALRVPHAVRRLLGEGSLSMTLTAWCAQLPANRVQAVSRIFFIRLALVLGVVLCLLWWHSAGLARILLPGFATEDLALAAELLCLAMPYVFWASLAALGMALLHSQGIFGPSALSPTVFNLVMLAFILTAACLPLPVPHTLALGMTCGGFAQWYVQWRVLCQQRTAAWQGGASGHSPVRLRHLPTGLVGAAAPQLVLLAAMGLASSEQGVVTALYYAERLLELPLGLVGVCLGMASLPSLSRYVAEGKMDAFVETLCTALRWSVWLGLAACAGLWAVGEMLVSLLFEHGSFSADAAQQTWVALAQYAAAIPACAAGRNLLAASNALGQARQTAWTSVLSLLMTLLLGALGFVPALAACIGLWVQPLCLFHFVRAKLQADGRALCLRCTWPLRGVIAALAAGCAAWWVQNAQPTGVIALLMAIGAGGLAWLAVVLACRGLTCAEK